jgi:hypothetical protein
MRLLYLIIEPSYHVLLIESTSSALSPTLRKQKLKQFEMYDRIITEMTLGETGLNISMRKKVFKVVPMTDIYPINKRIFALS